MWRELIGELYPEAELPGPADEATIAEIEKVLSLPLPFELGSLLGECNGVHNQYGDAVVWSAERVVEDNLAMRSEPDYLELYAPLDEMIFFGDSDMGPRSPMCTPITGPGSSCGITRLISAAWSWCRCAITWCAASPRETPGSADGGSGAAGGRGR